MVKRRVELAPRRSAPAQPEDAAELPAGGEATDAPMPAQKRAKFSIHDLLLNHEAKDEPPTLDELRTASGTPESTAGRRRSAEFGGGDLGAQLAVNWTAAGDSAVLAGVRCVLESRELWSKFHKLSTEMIITKSGR
ncbi:hypothetical protein M3Y99_01819600 [Aphelenchoides fujianensis]|nr:hypothetical protein M3Y99_01819600 [Aphelenchoides fujianensis]